MKSMPGLNEALPLPGAKNALPVDPAMEERKKKGVKDVVEAVKAKLERAA